MAQPTERARFRYKTFKGSPKEDPDEWLEDFLGTAQANGEDQIKLTTLVGVLRGEARPWYNALPFATRNDWNVFKQEFLHEFRKVGEESEALIKIGQLMMKKKESVRRFLQRFNRVAKKIDLAPADNMKLRWFISALPKKMVISVRQAHPLTLEAAQSYRSVDISSMKSRKKKKKRYDSSDSTSSEEDSSSFESEEESSSSSDSESSSSEDQKIKKKKKQDKSKKKKVSRGE
ncbi:unnamed protein product [Calypogeia fissa]